MNDSYCRCCRNVTLSEPGRPVENRIETVCLLLILRPNRSERSSRSDYAIQAASIGALRPLRRSAKTHSAPVILYYDYILTLPQEIQFMWNGARKTSTLLYIFCRYAMVANVMYLLYKTPGVTGLEVRCHVLLRSLDCSNDVLRCLVHPSPLYASQYRLMI